MITDDSLIREFLQVLNWDLVKIQETYGEFKMSRRIQNSLESLAVHAPPPNQIHKINICILYNLNRSKFQNY